MRKRVLESASSALMGRNSFQRQSEWPGEAPMHSTSMDKNDPFGVNSDDMDAQLRMTTSLVAQPMPSSDPWPAVVGNGLYVGNKYHAHDARGSATDRVSARQPLSGP